MAEHAKAFHATQEEVDAWTQRVDSNEQTEVMHSASPSFIDWFPESFSKLCYAIAVIYVGVAVVFYGIKMYRETD